MEFLGRKHGAPNGDFSMVHQGLSKVVKTKVVFSSVWLLVGLGA